MVPNVAGTGTSFKGAALYYLHDKRQEGEAERLTSDRVAWSETRNLSTDDPELAWRIMAATAMDQDRLKAGAGIKATGRKSNASVYAYSIAWHPEEAGALTREEMVRAAEESIRALGAQDRQAILIAHRDEPHPHVHVMLNRVSPVDGRMMGTSNDFKKLDAWALAYRRARGEEQKYCPARAEKDAAKRKHAAGEDVEFVRGQKPTPRAMEADYGQARAANDNSARQERDRQKALNAELAGNTKRMYAQHREQWTKLSATYRERKAAIYADTSQAIARARDSVKALYRPTWRDLYRRQHQQQRQFAERETRIGGKIENALAAIVHRRELDPENSRGFLSAALNFLTSKAARAQVLEKRHAKEQRVLAHTQKRALDQAIVPLKTAGAKAAGNARVRFGAEREALIAGQAAERAANSKQWSERKAETSRVFETIRREAAARQQAKLDHDARLQAVRDKYRNDFKNAGRRRSRGLALSRKPRDGDGSE